MSLWCRNGDTFVIPLKVVLTVPCDQVLSVFNTKHLKDFKSGLNQACLFQNIIYSPEFCWEVPGS